MLPALAIVATITGGLALWYVYLRRPSPGQRAVDWFARLRAAYTRRNAARESGARGLNPADNPILAAATFLYALALADPATAHRGEETIRKQLGGVVAEANLDDVMAFAWAAGSVVDARECVRKFRELWRDTLKPDERAELVKMAEEVAALPALPVLNQALAVEALRAALTEGEGQRAPS